MNSKTNAPPFREVTVGKLERDAANMLRYARFVLVLNSTKVRIIDNGDRRINGLPYAKIIAVLGPVQHKDIFLQKSVLMEVGYSRTRPYAQLEKRPRGEAGNRSGHRWNLKPRIRIRGLSEEEMVLVYPDIIRCMTTIVLEGREKWKEKGPRWVRGAGYVERGIYFTVSHFDKIPYRQMMLEDVRYRKNKYISKHVKWIRLLLGKYKHSYYSSRRLRKFAVSQRVVGLLSQQHYTPFYRAVFCSLFIEGTHERALLDSIVETFGLDVSLGELDTYILAPAPVILPEFKDLWCHRPVKQQMVHAKNASTFELILERRYREQNEIPF